MKNQLTVTFNNQNYIATYNSQTGYYELELQAPDVGGIYKADISFTDLYEQEYEDSIAVQILVKEKVKIETNKVFMWIFDHIDFTVKDIVEIANYDINIDEETNANENDSDIKKYLDSWYKQNIEDKGLSEYIADSGFCNDRSLSTRSNNGDGFQTTDKATYYAGYQRFVNFSMPSLVCPNEDNDLFTTASGDKGNKTLTYPIGLITVDELALSGYANNYLNNSSYTYSSSSYSTMSPSYFTVGDISANIFILPSTGNVGGGFVTGSRGVRGVINLKGDVEISGGIGTSNDPFVVITS